MRAKRRPSSCSLLICVSLSEKLRSDAAQEKFHCAPHPLGEFVRPGQVHCPLPNDRVVEPFHELRQVHYGKCACHLASLLALRENFSKQARSSLFMTPQFCRPHWVHGSR